MGGEGAKSPEDRCDGLSVARQHQAERGAPQQRLHWGAESAMRCKPLWLHRTQPGGTLAFPVRAERPLIDHCRRTPDRVWAPAI
jgi:hypothetical protein